MSISRCPTCEMLVDEDFNVEHYEDCKLEHQELQERLEHTPEKLLEILNKARAEMKEIGL